MSNTDKLRDEKDIEDTNMWLLMLEAGVALFLLVFIVWWTMFSGRKPNAPKTQEPKKKADNAPPKN